MARTKTFALHRLLAEYFIPNPENKPIVHHINGLPDDNRLENLAWVTQEENCALKHNISPKVPNTIPIFSEEELANEIWVPLEGTHYLISNLGRKKNLKTNFISIGCQNKNSGYIRWTFGSFGKMQAHRAVYKAFHPNEDIKVINHIDGNRANNRLENLENITQSENVNKSLYNTRTKKTRCVAQYDKDGNFINAYPSLVKCAEAIGVANGTVIRNSILGNYNCKGFKLAFITEEEYKKFKNI